MALSTNQWSADDIVTVQLNRVNDTASFQMLHRNYSDQVATAIASGGWQSFEPPMPTIYYSHVSKVPGLVIDIGINTGFYALLACAASDMNTVLGFEPNPKVHAFLQQNLELSRLVNRIDVLPLALSNREGRANLYVPDASHGLVETASSLDAAWTSAYSEIIEVSVSTLDTVLSSAEWQGKRVSTIKIDVEGHELSVLEGAAATIGKSRPLIFVEILHRADYAALSRLIADHEYFDVPLRPGAVLSACTKVAFDQAAWNHAFVPAELLSSFLREK